MRQCRSCGGCCGGGYVKGRKYIPCKSTASPVSGDAQISGRDARIAELEKENAALRSKVSWYDHHHAKLRACCEMLTGPLWPQNEATEKLAEVLADFPTPPEAAEQALNAVVRGAA